MLTANEAWLKTLQELISSDNEYLDIKGALEGTYTVKEILNHELIMDMDFPQVTIKSRQLNLEYAREETRMILSGSNLLDWKPIIRRTLEKWSEDKMFVRSAYGPRFIDQLPYILSIFKHDIHTRRAVISLWRDSPAISMDTTCLITLQYIIRDGYLNCIANMRSSDAYLGLPNDIACFSYLAEAVRLYLEEYSVDIKLRLGMLYCNAASRHIYAKDLDKVLNILAHPET